MTQNSDLIRRVKEYYLGSVASLAEISRQSQELFGQFVEREAMKEWSMHDPEGQWYLLRAQARAGNYELEIEDIRTIVYLDIMNPETPPATRAQLVNSYMNISSKGRLPGQQQSAKTPLQQALELKTEAISELSLEDMKEIRE